MVSGKRRRALDGGSEFGEDFAGQSDPRDLVAERDHLHFGVERLAAAGRGIERLEGEDGVEELDRGAGVELLREGLGALQIAGFERRGVERHRTAGGL